MRISDWSSDVCSSDLVALIFEIEGEAGFRKRETALLNECSQYRGMVLATGGGAVLAAENGRVLKDRKSVVSGKRVSVGVDLGGGRIIKNKRKQYEYSRNEV